MTESALDWSSLKDGVLMAILANPHEPRESKTAAFAVIVTRYYRILLERTAQHFRSGHPGRSQLFAEDGVQEAFAVLVDKAHYFDPDRPLLPWLAKLVQNLTLNLLRREGRYQAISAAEEALSGREPTPLEQLVRREILDNLPPGERAILTAFYLEKRSAVEIARLYRWEVSRVYRVLHSIRTRLRAVGVSGIAPDSDVDSREDRAEGNDQ
jgi:RNA polymerase sigma-70 factor (ECF subfamily)